jgi:hypothetical protein
MAETNADIDKESELLNEKMSDVFDWSDDDTIVRDAIWNHMMESDDRSTDETVKDMKPIIDMNDDQLRDYVEKNLHK